MTTSSTDGQIDHPTPVLNYVFPDLNSFPTLLNDRLLKSARNESPLELDTPPIWIMRQAGRKLQLHHHFHPIPSTSHDARLPVLINLRLTLFRGWCWVLGVLGYLPEFLEVRKNNSFFTVCRTPELACQVTLQPIDRFDGLLDASITFSDILVLPQAMGMEVQMLGGVGPHFPAPLLSPEDAQVRILDRKVDVFAELNYVYAATTLIRRELKGRVPLIGFCAGPWTLFGYMVEGGGSRNWEKAKKWLYSNPDSAKAVLQRIAEVSAEYLVGQARAGAQVRSRSKHSLSTSFLFYVRS